MRDLTRHANLRLYLRVTPEFVDRIETWRLSQPAPPTKTAAVLHLINLGLETSYRHRLSRPRTRSAK
jgi:hypothetical protein